MEKLKAALKDMADNYKIRPAKGKDGKWAFDDVDIILVCEMLHMHKYNIVHLEQGTRKPCVTCSHRGTFANAVIGIAKKYYDINLRVKEIDGVDADDFSAKKFAKNTTQLAGRYGDKSIIINCHMKLIVDAETDLVCNITKTNSEKIIRNKLDKFFGVKKGGFSTNKIYFKKSSLPIIKDYRTTKLTIDKC